MKPFLYSIAEAYLKHDSKNVANYCFIFPNKRSCIFFHHAFAKASRKLGIHTPHPASTTISSFIEELVAGKPAERMEMIFILYQAYREIIYRHGGSTVQSQEFAQTLDFNKFQRWADLILGDFNDVDMYLVDPTQLFPNLEHYREISANYLDEEVIEEIKRHWRADRIPEFSNSFWNHIAHPGNALQDEESDSSSSSGSAIQFFKLWQVMLELYEAFRKRLSTLGLFYPGMAYREAINTIKERETSDFSHTRYIFVGFNMLSKSEETIFRLMKEKGHRSITDDIFADFYFDNASPAFTMDGNTTANLLRDYVEKFPPLYDCIEQITGFPKIEITGVASKVGQAKIAGTIIKTLYPKDGNINSELLRHTAIILPQESLAQGVITALPTWISPINLTMGYRLRDSRVATLVRNIVSMHLRSRKANGNRPTFFYEDVITILTHPLLRQSYPTECSRIIYEININRWYNIDASDLISKYPAFTPLFKYIENSGSTEEIFTYFENLFNWLLSTWQVQAQESAITGTMDADGLIIEDAEQVKAAAIIDRMLTKAYLRSIDRLKSLISQYLPDKELFLSDSTIFHLLERLVGGESVNFEGRPLDGLQVMGVLEARNLDFDNIVLLSMNERIFPRKHYQKSFIPPHLRHAYGMATQEHQESIYSYYFYRMISRARRVFLLYDARTQGIGGGQMSRYLNQLLYLYNPSKIRSQILGYNFESQPTSIPQVKKTDKIMAELNRYRSTINPRKLSASAINTYINCPLSFYLTYIAGFKREDEFHDYMDESTFGTIIHSVLEDIYKTASKRYSRFNADVIHKIKAETITLQQTITRRINQHYIKLGENCLTPLKGDAEIFGRIMLQYINLTLDRDIEAGDFSYIAGEYGVKNNDELFQLVIKGSSDEAIINFVYSIDRVDEHFNDDGTSSIRIIDYKTGEDPTQIVDLIDMFQSRNSSTPRAKAMLQLFMYAQAYAQQTAVTASTTEQKPIQPWIYSIRKVATEPFTPLKIADSGSVGTDGSKKRYKVDITDYSLYVEEFNDLLLEKLKELFDPQTPFTPAEDDHACTFCKFTEICRKPTPSSF